MTSTNKTTTLSPEPEPRNSSGQGNASDVPDGVKGWSWGALGLNVLWAIGNRTWIGLLVFIPYVGFLMAIVLGIKGREWAWKNKQWDSVEHFQRVQKTWSRWGVFALIIWIFVGFAASSYQSYKSTIANNYNPLPSAVQKEPSVVTKTTYEATINDKVSGPNMYVTACFINSTDLRII